MGGMMGGYGFGGFGLIGMILNLVITVGLIVVVTLVAFEGASPENTWAQTVSIWPAVLSSAFSSQRTTVSGKRLLPSARPAARLENSMAVAAKAITRSRAFKVEAPIQARARAYIILNGRA